jgi:hypothetical protein
MWRALLFASLLTAQTVAAVADCMCRYKGGRVNQGETACIDTTSGPRIARCGMILNSPNWFILDQSCTVSRLEEPALPRSLAAAPLPNCNLPG